MKIYLPLFLIVSLLFSGCGHQHKSIIMNSHDHNIRQYNYVVLPFKSSLPEEQEEKYKNAPEILKELVEANLLSSGINVISRDNIDLLIDEEIFRSTGFTKEHRSKIGNMLNADAVVVGTVNNFFSGNDFKKHDEYYGRYTTVGFTVKAIHVETGSILWSITNDREEGCCMYAGVKPQSFAVKTVQGAIDELIKEIDAARKNRR